MSFLFPGVAESLNIRLLSAGYITLGSWWTETDLIREFWRLYLNYEDGAALKIGQRTYPLPANRIVLVPAGVDFEPILERPVMQLFVQFEFVGWPAKAAQEVIPAPVLLDPCPQRDQLAAELKIELSEAREVEPIIASRLKALTHLSIATVLSDIPEEVAQQVVSTSHP